MASRHAVAFISSALGLWLYSSASYAAVTHTTANLNLRSGPSTSHKVKAVIPAGAAIDIHSCGHTWCYMGWAGHDVVHVHEHPAPQPQKMGTGT
jgi:uncharacterized protein YraI